MTTYRIYHEQIPATDSRLRRHILHDDRSWLYRFDTSGIEIESVEHSRKLPIWDQGKVGSCTADTGMGILATFPYYSDKIFTDVFAAMESFTQDPGVYNYYSQEQVLDGNGPYPPNDYGSTGLTMAKIARAQGFISGWRQTFNMTDMLKALQRFPIGTGSYWYNSMFEPDARTNVVPIDPSSGIAGGHEYLIVGYDKTRGLLHMANSWGTSWGKDGYAWLEADAWESACLLRRGDVTIFTPRAEPAPIPTPDADELADSTLAATFRRNNWVGRKHWGDNGYVARAADDWLTAKGL